MTEKTRHIGIGFGELKHLHDGLGEFSNQFGRHISARARALRDEFGIQFYFHIPTKWHGYFGDDVTYMYFSKHQRRLHLTRTRFDIWHNLHQHIRQRPPLFAKHVITTLHDLNLVYMKSGGSLKRGMRRQLALLNRADEIICISDYVLEDLRRFTKLQQPAHRIYNGVRDLGKVPQAPPTAPVPSDYFFHIGRMAPNKNVNRIIDLACAWPERQFVLAGPRCDETETHLKVIQQKGLKNIIMLFNISDQEKAWLYGHCAGLIFPSSTEGFGLPPIEAMSLGKQVFLSRATCLPEIGGELASYFDQLDPESMKRTILAGELRKAKEIDLSSRIRQWANQFSWDHCIEQYLACYMQTK